MFEGVWVCVCMFEGVWVCVCMFEGVWGCEEMNVSLRRVCWCEGGGGLDVRMGVTKE